MTGDKGSFINIANGIKSNVEISDVTIQDAFKNGNGSVIDNNSADAVITLDNTIIKIIHQQVMAVLYIMMAEKLLSLIVHSQITKLRMRAEQYSMLLVKYL